MSAGAVVAALDPKLTWYVARAGGLVAWATCSASILWGLALSTGAFRRIRSSMLLDLHRYLGTLTVVFAVIHLVALWLDDFVAFGLVEMAVPMASSWRPGAVAWGVVAAYLLLAIMVTSWGMRWLPRRAWRVVHLSAYGLFATATVHGYQSGTDRVNRLVVAVGGVVTVAIVVAVAGRLVRIRRTRRAPRRAGDARGMLAR